MDCFVVTKYDFLFTKRASLTTMPSVLNVKLYLLGFILSRNFNQTAGRHPAKLLAVAQGLLRADALPPAAVSLDHLPRRAVPTCQRGRPGVPGVIQLYRLDVVVCGREGVGLAGGRRSLAAEVDPSALVR